jgi:hypothetical protein
MERETIANIIATLKPEQIDFVVTLLEEPTAALTGEIRRIPPSCRRHLACENGCVSVAVSRSGGN